MTNSITFACRTCHAQEQTSACKKCCRTYYCGRECQKLDWKKHKVFCNSGEETSLAQARRDACLQKIQQFPDAIFCALMHLKFVSRHGFLHLTEESSLKFYPKAERGRYHKFGISLDDQTYNELNDEMVRAVPRPAVVLLYTTESISRVYLISRANIVEQKNAIENLPLEVACNIFCKHMMTTCEKMSKYEMRWIAETIVNLRRDSDVPSKDASETNYGETTIVPLIMTTSSD
jgi:hypothetical protein